MTDELLALLFIALVEGLPVAWIIYREGRSVHETYQRRASWRLEP